MNKELEVIKFKNGSYIKIIPSKESKHGYIRGKRLTDEEYKRMIFRENINAEQIVNNIIKNLDYEEVINVYSADDLWLLIGTKDEAENDLKLATNRLKRAANDIDFYSLFGCKYEELRDIYKHIGNYIEDEEVNNDFKQLIEKKKIEKYPELLKPTYYPEINLLNISDEEKLRLDKAVRFNLRYYINERNCVKCFYIKSIKDMELLHSIGIVEKKYSFRCEYCGCSCLTISEQDMKDYKRIWFLEDKGTLSEDEDEELASLYEKGILAINLYCMDCEDFEVEICNEKDLENYMENVEIVYKVVKEPDLRYEKI